MRKEGNALEALLNPFLPIFSAHHTSGMPWAFIPTLVGDCPGLWGRLSNVPDRYIAVTPSCTRYFDVRSFLGDWKVQKFPEIFPEIR